ncbi:MAG: beta-eliminating lyase-related protein [Byssovorax sp.]
MPLDKRAVRAACPRSLSYHLPEKPRAVLAALAASTPADLDSDDYGEGPLIEGFEKEIAALLGKPAAVFLPSGTMAQQIAARIWAERRGCPAIAYHPTCHLEVHEHKGYEALHRLRAVPVGPRTGLFGRADLDALHEPVAMLLVELPQRSIGGLLPSWEELSAISAWAKEHKVALQLDGARLWESQPFYDRSYAEIAGLFDSVYVSFYKILGGIAGAALAGPEDFIAEARVWQRRHGGNLVHLYPFVLSARRGLDARLGRMRAYHDKAAEIAEHLAQIPGVEVTPRPPHTNMAHVYLRGDIARLEEAALEVASARGVWLWRALTATALPGLSYFELVAGDATLEVPADEAAALITEVLERARG